MLCPIAANILDHESLFLSSLVASLYPAIKLHWLKPVEAMRAA